MADQEEGDLDVQLRLCAEQRARWLQANAAQDEVRERIAKLVAREQHHRRRAEAAAEELASCRSFWPSALWARWTGAAEQQAIAAKAVLEEARKECDGLDGQLAEAHAELDRHGATLRVLAGVPERHATLLRAKDAALRANGGELADRAEAAAAAIAELQREQQAVQRLLEHARSAEGSLENARDLLQGARHAGALDLLTNNVLLANAKFRTYDQARGAMLRAQQSMQRFVDDVGTEGEALGRIDIAGGLRLADVLLDGLLVQMLTLSKIDNAADLVRDVLPKVRDMALGLERRLQELGRGRAAAESARIAWLESVSG